MVAPKAILVGGANGAGKTTLARQYLPLLYPNIQFLNADEIQSETSTPLSSVAAGKVLLRRLLRGSEHFVQAYRPLFDLWYHWKTDEQGLQLFARKGPSD